jgi:glyceraldehyde 3-phosphate dehydrogenase
MTRTRVAINGFGRIGRLAARRLLDHPTLELVAINDLAENEALAYLFKYDSVHGSFPGDVTVEGDVLHAGGHTVRMTEFRNPLDNKWGDIGVDIVLECTGVFVDRPGNQAHFDAGAKRVIISAPAKGPDITVVMGVNEEQFDPAKHTLISNASCTTNCVAPPLKALNDAFGVQYAVINTTHAYTMSQSLLDAPQKKNLRQGRAAALNLIPTSTGAAKAVGEVIPSLKGKLHGLAVRTPNPTGSLADITMLLEKDADVAAVHEALAAYEARNPSVFKLSKDELVSADIIGSSYSSIVDSLMTMKVGPLLKILSWYDNEAGYATRLVDIAAFVAKRANG